MFFGVGMIVGSTTAAITTQWFNPFITYSFWAFFAFSLMISCFFITDEVETNEYALHLSDEDKMYEQER